MYQVIARKYRPQAFAELIGQEHVRTTLENAIAQQRIAHGYIFSGQRGTGKTTVALHRIAFLVFNDPRHFRPSRCLFVVPSEALARYVAGVLPALGVQGVPVTTYRSWARNLRKRLVPSAPDHYAEDTPAAVARLKKHPALLALVEPAAAAQARAQIASLGATYAAAGAEIDEPAERTFDTPRRALADLIHPDDRAAAKIHREVRCRGNFDRVIGRREHAREIEGRRTAFIGTHIRARAHRARVTAGIGRRGAGIIARVNSRTACAQRHGFHKAAVKLQRAQQRILSG